MNPVEISFTPYLITGIIAAALLLFSAIAIKKSRPLGIVVAFLQIASVFAVMKVDALFAAIQLGTSSSIMERMLPQVIKCFPWMLVVVGVYAFNMVYAISLNKQKGRGFAIAATILTILQCFFITPVERSVTFITNSLGQGPGLIGVVFRAIFLLPMLLLAIQGIMNLLAKDAAPAVEPVAEPAAEPAQEQQPAQEEKAE